MSLWFIVVFAAACSRRGYEAPELADGPVVSSARLGDIELTAPAYGVALERGGEAQFEVNVEAEDAPAVRAGQPCRAYVPPSTATVSCSVARVLRGASAETGQALAWLAPRAPGAVARGEFVFALITTGVKTRALVAPAAAVLTKEGRTWVIRRRRGEKDAFGYEPVAVKTGASAAGLVEIASGLKPGDEVVVEGGLGYLYPEFKAGAGD